MDNSDDEAAENADLGTPLYQEETTAIEAGFSIDESSWLHTRFARMAQVMQSHMRDLHESNQEMDKGISRNTLNSNLMFGKVTELKKILNDAKALTENLEMRMRKIEESIENMAISVGTLAENAARPQKRSVGKSST